MRVSLEQLIWEPHFKPLTLLWKPERGMRAAAAGAAGPQGMAGRGRHVEGQPVSLSPRRLLPGVEPRLRARRGHAGWHPREVAVPSQPPWLDRGYSPSGCRLVCAVLCDTSRQLPPPPQGGGAARVLYCLQEVASWFGGVSSAKTCSSPGFICSVLCPLGGRCQNQSRMLGVVAWPRSCGPTGLGTGAQGFGGA